MPDCFPLPPDNLLLMPYLISEIQTAQGNIISPFSLYTSKATSHDSTDVPMLTPSHSTGLKEQTNFGHRPRLQGLCFGSTPHLATHTQ